MCREKSSGRTNVAGDRKDRRVRRSLERDTSHFERFSKIINDCLVSRCRRVALFLLRLYTEGQRKTPLKALSPLCVL